MVQRALDAAKLRSERADRSQSNIDMAETQDPASQTPKAQLRPDHHLFFDNLDRGFGVVFTAYCRRKTSKSKDDLSRGAVHVSVCVLFV